MARVKYDVSIFLNVPFDKEYKSIFEAQDIQAHHNHVKEAIRCVRNWLYRSPEATRQILPSADYIYERYLLFRRQLPGLCKEVGLMIKDLQFSDYRAFVSAWLKTNPMWDDKRVE